MTDRDPPIRSTLDALLSENRKRFDDLFSVQMSGSRTVRSSAAGPEAKSRTTGPEVKSTPLQRFPPEPAPENTEGVIADLDRKFGSSWSSETIGHRIENRVAVAEVALTVGHESIREEASSPLVEGESEDAAVQRAVTIALERGAARFDRAADAASPPLPQTSRDEDAIRPVERVDAVDAQRVAVALRNIRAEMACLLARSAASSTLARPDGCETMLMDGRGHMVSGSSGSFLRHMIETKKLHLGQGDALLMSDPFETGGATLSLDRWLLVCPVFHGSDLIGFSAVSGQMTDVGGAAAGTASTDARSVFAEGLRIPPIKIFEGGAINGVALDLILANGRMPDTARSDLMAMVDACRAGAARMVALAERLGADHYHQACAAILARAKVVMRDRIVALVPEEPQSFEDVIDDDGCGSGPLKLRLTVWREGDHAFFDWTGSSDQTPGPVNFCLHVGLAKMLVGRCLLRSGSEDVATSDGYYDLIHVTLPKGSILNPDFPASTGQYPHAYARHVEVLGAALDRLNPARLCAAGGGAMPKLVFSGRAFRLVDNVPAGAPGTPEGDGEDALTRALDLGLPSAEDLEADFPLLVESNRSVPGSGGVGRHRGGHGMEKVFRFLEAGQVSLQDDRQVSRPWGVNGGGAGSRSEKWIERAEGGRETLPSKIDGLDVGPGDRLVFRSAGGGGCGDPLERDPALVRFDVQTGHLTVESAGRDYGVVIAPHSSENDRRATDALRDGLRRERPHPTLFDRGDQA